MYYYNGPGQNTITLDKMWFQFKGTLQRIQNKYIKNGLIDSSILIEIEDWKVTTHLHMSIEPEHTVKERKQKMVLSCHAQVVVYIWLRSHQKKVDASRLTK